MTCARCDKPAETSGYCKLHWAEYQRDYRARAVSKKDRAAHFRGFTECLEVVARYLRLEVGDKALTGHQTAKVLERAIIVGDTPEVTARQQLIQSLRAGG